MYILKVEIRHNLASVFGSFFRKDLKGQSNDILIPFIYIYLQA